MAAERDCIAAELKQRIASGCTYVELIRTVERMLVDDVNASTVVRLISDTFEVHAGYASHSQMSLRDAALLNSSLLPKIVANRAEWETSNSNGGTWMDEIRVQPPCEDSEDVIPFGVSTGGWQALSDADKERLLTAKRSSEWAFYCKSVLATLCEQLQLRVSRSAENGDQ